MLNFIGSILILVGSVLLVEFLVNRSRNEEKVIKQTNNKEWTTDEIVFLANNYKEITAKEIFKEFEGKHSVNSIYKMARKITK